MIDLTSPTFLVGTAVGLAVGVLVAGWWVTVRVQSRHHARLLESGERAQRADAVAASLQQRVDDQQSEMGQLRDALAESQQGRTKAETRMEAVSYTHLDVYKRQGESCSMGHCRDRGPSSVPPKLSGWLSLS